MGWCWVELTSSTSFRPAVRDRRSGTARPPGRDINEVATLVLDAVLSRANAGTVRVMPEVDPVPPAEALDRLRALCLALPGVTERVSHGEPSWFAGRSS